MFSTCPVPTKEVATIFRGEAKVQGGTVIDIVDDGARLFGRALLPFVEEVRPKDRLKGGVAVAVFEEKVQVRPFVYREICRNGAVMAQSIRAVELAADYSGRDVFPEIRDAIRACCQREVFAESMSAMHATLGSRFDVLLVLLPMLLRHAPDASFRKLLLDQLPGFLGAADSPAYHLMNAITAHARDTADPEARWRMEELGGSIGAWLKSGVPPALSGAAARPSLAHV